MKIEIEIVPRVVGDYDGAWTVKTTYGGETYTRESEDVTFAVESAEERLSMAMDQAFPGIEESYR